MKNLKMKVLLIVLALCFVSGSVFALTKSIEVTTNDIKIKVNGKNIQTQVQPMIIEGRTVLGLRDIGVALGMSVKYNEIDNIAELNSTINGQGFIKTKIANCNAIAVEGDDTYISVKSLMDNKDKLVSDLLKTVGNNITTNNITADNRTTIDNITTTNITTNNIITNTNVTTNNITTDNIITSNIITNTNVTVNNITTKNVDVEDIPKLKITTPLVKNGYPTFTTPEGLLVYSQTANPVDPNIHLTKEQQERIIELIGIENIKKVKIASDESNRKLNEFFKNGGKLNINNDKGMDFTNVKQLTSANTTDISDNIKESLAKANGDISNYKYNPVLTVNDENSDFNISRSSKFQIGTENIDKFKGMYYSYIRHCEYKSSEKAFNYLFYNNDAGAQYSDFSIVALFDEDNDIVKEVTFSDFSHKDSNPTFKTNRGISTKSTIKDVLDKYGVCTNMQEINNTEILTYDFKDANGKMGYVRFFAKTQYGRSISDLLIYSINIKVK